MTARIMCDRQLHAAREFWRLFFESLRKHRKRGNRNLPPLGIVLSWRMAQCGRGIIIGRRRPFRWMRTAGFSLEPPAEAAE